MAAEEAATVLGQIADGSFPGSAWGGASVEFWLGWITMQDGLHDRLDAVDRDDVIETGQRIRVDGDSGLVTI